MHVLVQVYTMHASSKNDAVAQGQETKPIAEGSVVNDEAEQESVRDMLRQAITVEDLKSACKRAQDLGMEFEVSLAERKLSKLVT